MAVPSEQDQLYSVFHYEVAAISIGLTLPAGAQGPPGAVRTISKRSGSRVQEQLLNPRSGVPEFPLSCWALRGASVHPLSLCWVNERW